MDPRFDVAPIAVTTGRKTARMIRGVVRLIGLSLGLAAPSVRE